MSAQAHLRLVVSEPAAPTEEEALHDRPSMIQPVDPLRSHLHWLRARAISLFSLAALVCYGLSRLFD